MDENENTELKEKKSKTSPLTYRTTDEVRIAIEKYFSDQGVQPGNVWGEVLKLIEQHKLQENFPQHAALLKTFIANNNRTVELFYAMLSLAKSAKAQSLDECKAQMLSKDKSIQDLQEQIEQLKKSNDDMMKVNGNLSKENLALKEEKEKLSGENVKLHDQVQKLEAMMMDKLENIGKFVQNAVEEKQKSELVQKDAENKENKKK